MKARKEATKKEFEQFVSDNNLKPWVAKTATSKASFYFEEIPEVVENTEGSRAQSFEHTNRPDFDKYYINQ